MKQSVLRMALTALSLLLVFAGSSNLNRAGANQPYSPCDGVCGCPPSGPDMCCSFSDRGGTVTCYARY